MAEPTPAPIVAASPDDQISPETIGAIVSEVATALEAAGARAQVMRIPGGPEVGRQIVIDATEKGGLVNKCRLSSLSPDLAPAGEVVRLEYEHDKQGKFEVRQVYSIQSVRRVRGELVLLENFLAETAADVREHDFRPVLSERYARATVLSTVQDWVRYAKATQQ